jgi:hypothetical protein
MNELNDRAREHAEASRRRLIVIGGGGEGGYQTNTTTYWNPARVVVYRFYDSTGGGVSVFGPTETLPDVPANSVQFSGSDDENVTDVTITDKWTEPPWEGWRAISISTIARAVAP